MFLNLKFFMKCPHYNLFIPSCCFLFLDFSIQTLLSNWGISEVPAILPAYLQSILLEETGVLYYLQEQTCDAALTGWNTGTVCLYLYRKTSEVPYAINP